MAGVGDGNEEDRIAWNAIQHIVKPSTGQQAIASKTRSLLAEPEADRPFIDLHELFHLFDQLYFGHCLGPAGVEVEWSKRMTLCAGLCELMAGPKTGSQRRIRVKLSEPVLKFRPRSDMVDTLLHEMIHAFFFLTTHFRHGRPATDSNAANGGHGAAFIALSEAINQAGGFRITVFHSFVDEVDHYRRHVWTCNGPCQDRPPFFGIVKRAMNRPPGRLDGWWARHKTDCGGEFSKISEPEKQERRRPEPKQPAGQKNTLDRWIGTAKPADVDAPVASTQKRKRREDGDDDDVDRQDERSKLVECPVCPTRVNPANINDHLDGHFGSGESGVVNQK